MMVEEKKNQPTSGKKTLQAPQEVTMMSDAENVQLTVVKGESTSVDWKSFLHFI